MDQELVAYLDRLSQQIEGVRGEMSKQMDDFRGEVREENRHTRIIVEGLRSDIQLMAEVVLDTRDLFVKHKSAVERQLEEMKILLSLPYKDLNTRVTILEERAERWDGDVLDIFRRKFGKSQA